MPINNSEALFNLRRKSDAKRSRDVQENRSTNYGASRINTILKKDSSDKLSRAQQKRADLTDELDDLYYRQQTVEAEIQLSDYYAEDEISALEIALEAKSSCGEGFHANYTLDAEGKLCSFRMQGVA